MKSIIQGKNVEQVYSVEVKKDDNGKFLSKPKIVIEENITWEDILEVDGEIKFNSKRSPFNSFVCGNEINLSTEDKVSVLEQVYRADLNVIMIHTDKILEEYSTNYYEAESELKDLLADYNEQMIMDDEKLDAYCDVHKLKLRETDVNELKKIVYGVNDNTTIYFMSQELVPNTITNMINSVSAYNSGDITFKL